MGYFTDRRNFKRTEFNNPLQATMETVTLYADSVNKPILILDMSAGGLKFVSEFEFMVNFIEIYKVNLTLDNKDLVLFGNIIRKRILNNNIYEYSFKFNFSYIPKTI